MELTALIYTAWKNHNEIAQELIKKNADVNANIDGMPALVIASAMVT